MKHFSLIVGALCLLCACDGSVTGALYDEQAYGSGFTFAGTVLNVETTIDDGGIVKVPVYRGKLAADMARIACEFYDEEKREWVKNDPAGLFRLATERVVFIDGSLMAYAQVGYSSIDDLGLTKKHSFRLYIQDDVSPGGNSTCNVTLNRRLTFHSLGVGKIYDEFLSDSDIVYDVEILKAEEADVYRVMHPFDEMLVTEGFQAIGWMTTTCEYLQIELRKDGSVRFDEFRNGMYFNKTYVVYGVNPPERSEHVDVDLSKYANRMQDEHTIVLQPFYYMKNYGYFSDIYSMYVTLPE